MPGLYLLTYGDTVRAVRISGVQQAVVKRANTITLVACPPIREKEKQRISIPQLWMANKEW